MKLGGPILSEYKDPESWARACKALDYKAAYCPVTTDTDSSLVRAYAAKAETDGIIIAEVGAWNNPLDSDPVAREKAIEHCVKSLDLAERIGARCCVNISGGRGKKWDGPDSANLAKATFDMIVESVRGIIDSVKPTRTFYTLEPMPWMIPDSIDSYARLIKAVHRKAFAVHLDPVNIITNPRIYFDTTTFLRECFRKLGPWIKSIHAKDIILRDSFTVHLEEVRPGLGTLDYSTFLREASRLDGDVPVLVEHLPNDQEYKLATDYIRSVAKRENLAL
jgi:sugar phosphate isomerase/epimerase